MAVTEYNYIPKYIKRTIDNKPKDVVTASYWNELFNLLITQGDHTAKELGNILNHFTTVITDLANDTSQSTSGLSNKLGDLNNLVTVDKSNLVASINEVKNTTDTKQDKLIAGKNINIAEDGKTISAASDMDDVIGYFRVTLTERGDGLYTGSKTFAQVKAEIESNKRFMFIDGYDCVLIVTRVGNALIEFAGMSDGTDGWLWVGVASDDRWEIVPEVRITLDWYNALANDIGKLTNLTTTDKTNLVAAVNEVKGIADGKQDKLIAGENITIAADGKTISATGGGGGGGVQSDWNQNDSTAADYVKNRPFYTGNPVENVLVEENTVPFEGGGDLYMGMLPQVVPVIAGETYKVYWDSTAYECTCVNSEGMSVLGNLSIPGFGSDTGEPFVLAVNISEETTEIYTTDTSATHTISVSGLVPEIVKIDKKYLPFDIPTKTSQLENDAGYLTLATLPKYEGVVV